MKKQVQMYEVFFKCRNFTANFFYEKSNFYSKQLFTELEKMVYVFATLLVRHKFYSVGFY